MVLKALQEVDSTNNWAAGHWEEYEKPFLVYANSQNSGRGQRGNTWESEPGKNLTCSYAFIEDRLRPHEQFAISEAVSLAVLDVLKKYGIEAKVKWPNDIYVDDSKICGILIEHSVMGRSIARSIAGIGLNINQETFLSDAPNPVSMKILTGKEYDVAVIAGELAEALRERLNNLASPDIYALEYKGKLWRGGGEYHFFSDKIRNKTIRGRIKDIGRDGCLILETSKGEIFEYGFKRIEFIQRHI